MLGIGPATLNEPDRVGRKDSPQLRASAIIVAGAGAFLVAGCSTGSETADADGNVATLAQEMISGELATTIGLGPLSSRCDDPGLVAADSMFACTAVTDSGAVIQIQGAVNDEGRLILTTTNLVSAAAIPSFERGAAALLNTSIGSNFTAESVDCGATAVVLPADFVMGCALVMPASAQVFDVMLTISDLDGRQFSLVVDEEPRRPAAVDPIQPSE